jgi:hypothetical protein
VATQLMEPEPVQSSLTWRCCPHLQCPGHPSGRTGGQNGLSLCGEHRLLPALATATRHSHRLKCLSPLAEVAETELEIMIFHRLERHQQKVSRDPYLVPEGWAFQDQLNTRVQGRRRLKSPPCPYGQGLGPDVNIALSSAAAFHLITAPNELKYSKVLVKRKCVGGGAGFGMCLGDLVISRVWTCSRTQPTCSHSVIHCWRGAPG